MRLIDADALMELYADAPDIKFDMLSVPIPVVRQNIIDMPTIEAEPVKHARWIDGADSFGAKSGTFRVCSHCHTCFKKDPIVRDAYWQWCPNCGAKMDGDTE